MKDRPEVLVVDDEASIRLLIRLNLELEGFRVREAADGEQAISLLEEYEPDVILLDLRMPGIDGWGVITWLERQRRLQGSQVLVISAHANEETIGLARQKGLHYVTKPFKIDELVQAVSEATCPTDNRAHDLLRGWSVGQVSAPSSLRPESGPHESLRSSGSHGSHALGS